MRAEAKGTKRKIQLAGRPMRRMRMEDMLSNALRLFAEVGYANATVKSIAAAADINPALLYYYYDNKESLFIATLRNAINAALDTHGGFDIIERSVDPAALIRYWFEKNRSLMTPLGQMLKLMIEYRTSGSRIASVDRLIEKFYGAELALLSRAIKRGIKSGQFRRVDVDRTAQFVSTHLDGLVISAVLRPTIDVARSLDHLEKVLFRHLAIGSTSDDLEAAA
jgi:TetR/AcrR family transcriptional regulator, upper aerobic nicotinate degradation pathway regulator